MMTSLNTVDDANIGDLLVINEPTITDNLKIDKAVCIGKSFDGTCLKLVSLTKETFPETVVFYMPLCYLQKTQPNMEKMDFGTPLYTRKNKKAICLSFPNPYPDADDVCIFMIDSKKIKTTNDYKLSIRRD